MNLEAIARKTHSLRQPLRSNICHELFDYTEYCLTAGNIETLQLEHPLNLIMVETGYLNLHCYDSSYLLEPGSLVVVDASSLQLASLESPHDTLVLCASLTIDMLERFRGRFAQALIERQKNASHSLSQEDSLLHFNGCDLTRMAITSFRLVQRKNDSALHSLKLEELLLLQLSQSQGDSLADRILRGCDPATARFRAFIEANYLNHWSLATFAQHAAMSLTTFKVQFNEIYKTSPRAWINEKRLRYADELLRTSSKRIIEIAFEAGFSSQSYFTQAYKSRFGCTPSEVR